MILQPLESSLEVVHLRGRVPQIACKKSLFLGRKLEVAKIHLHERLAFIGIALGDAYIRYWDVSPP